MFRGVFLRMVLPVALGLILGGGCATDQEATRQASRPLVQPYRGLAGQRVAVLVSADDHTLYRYPAAPQAVARAATVALARAVPSARLMNPRELNTFLAANPYWETLPPADLFARLDVDRLILIDLAHYSTHEPGNAHEWRGLILADVIVHERDRPNQPVFRAPVQAEFPSKPSLGVLDADDATIQLGLLDAFQRHFVLLFAETAEGR